MARKRSTPAPSDFDLGSIAIEDEDSLPTVSRGGRLVAMRDANPFTAAVWQSYELEQVKGVTVPGGTPLRDAYQLIRWAADDQGIGVRIVVITENGAGDIVRNYSRGKGAEKVVIDDSLNRAFKGEIDGLFRVKFQGQVRKVYKNGEDAENDVEADEDPYNESE